MFGLNKFFSVTAVVIFSLGFILSDVNANLLKIQDKAAQLSAYKKSFLAFDLIEEKEVLFEENIDYQGVLASEMLDWMMAKKTAQIMRYSGGTPGQLVTDKAKTDADSEAQAASSIARFAQPVLAPKTLKKQQKVERAPTKKKVKQTPKSKKKAKLFKLAKLNRIYHQVLANRIIPKKALIRAFHFYQKNHRRNGLSSRYITIVDYTKRATRRRMHMVNLKDGSIHSFFVAHGKNSGPYGGRVLSTSNERGSNKTSKGFFKIGFREGVTLKKRHRYLTVQGLERSNRRVGWPTRLGGRDIILHTAEYASKGGRSEGCFAIHPKDKGAVFSRIKGSLFYSYVG